MLYDEIAKGKKLPVDSEYKEDLKEIEFLDASFEADGEDYLTGDAPDGPIIHKLECESQDDYKSRRSRTPCRHFVSSILNKYNASVFRNEPSRPTEADAYQILLQDADGYGNSLNSVMRKALLKAQIEGTVWLLADSTESDTEILTIAQKRAADIRPYIRTLTQESIVNTNEVEGHILEAIVLLEDADGVSFARYMNESIFIDLKFNPKTLMITEVGNQVNHGYSSIPLVALEPLEDAQSEPIANSQRTIVNLLSLLNQELTDSVFTRWILNGVRIDDADEQKKISWSGKRLVVLESDTAKLTPMSADKTAADSLREQITMETDAMYEAAGLAKPNVEPTNMSGYALKISKSDFFTICDQLRHSCEQAENAIMELIADVEGYEYIPAIYSDKFIADDDGYALQQLRDLLALSLPKHLKNMAIKNYISTFYNVSNADFDIINKELMDDSEG